MNRKRTIWLVACLILTVAVLYFSMCNRKKEVITAVLPPLHLQGGSVMSFGEMTCKIWDNDTEDGDTVKVFLDGALIKDTIELLSQPLELHLGKLSKGKHLFVVAAISEGMSAPATASIGLNNGKDVREFIMNATRDTAASWTIIIQ
ncbi:hypothetical protein [Niabella hirudinis]|uniref:hypothetical protein n=1 Tax=Niabella hirudinis TaxID=1285929 RepID=UPI003EBEDCD9